MIDYFETSSNANVQLLPAVVNLDCQRNYPFAAPAPANPYTDVQITRQNNGLHPAPAGYKQIGDTVYAWLKAKLTTPADH